MLKLPALVIYQDVFVLYYYKFEPTLALFVSNLFYFIFGSPSLGSKNKIYTLAKAVIVLLQLFVLIVMQYAYFFASPLTLTSCRLPPRQSCVAS